MTTHKSTAVTKGIMPDFARAGVVLSRRAKFVSSDDSIVSGDTLQMVPVPKDAEILGVQVYYSALPAGFTGCDIGYGGDTDSFMATVPMTGSNIKSAYMGQTAGYQNVAGFLHKFTADDTIDIAFIKAPTKIETSQHINMTVWYKMIGSLEDET